MAVKWYLNKNDTSWVSFWERTSIDKELEEAKNDYPKILSAITENSHKDSVVLEGGCGLGKFLFYLREKDYKNLIGVDLTDEPLQLIKQRDSLMDVRKGDVNNLPVVDNSVDLYLSMGVIEHFESGPGKALDEAFRVIKKNGILIVAVPYLNIYRGTIRKYFTLPLLKLFKPSFRNKNRIFYQYYYSKRDLKKFIEVSGFETLSWFYYDHYHSKDRRVGIYLEFPFMRNKNGKPHTINWFGKIIAFTSELFSRGIFSSSIAYVVKKPK